MLIQIDHNAITFSIPCWPYERRKTNKVIYYSYSMADWAYLREAQSLALSRAIIGQRGALPVTSLGYLNFKKVIFRTMRTMRKQFPVNWLTSGRFSAPKRGAVKK